MALSTIQLMHLADSALPVGGFAFSNGLEAAVKSGVVASCAELEAYLKTALRQWAAFDLPFLNSLYEDGSPEVLQRYDRMMLSPSMRKGSIAQGRGWLRIFAELFPILSTYAFEERLKAAGLPPHGLPLMVLSLKSAGATVGQIRELFMFVQLRDQLSAAVRLGLIGPARAQRMQAEIEVSMAGELEAASGKTEAEAVRIAPLMDIAQMLQPSLYSKLFQN
jgi:urease accessory protein